jgi:hypothetical protein
MLYNHYRTGQLVPGSVIWYNYQADAQGARADVANSHRRMNTNHLREPECQNT